MLCIIFHKSNQVIL